MAYTQIGGNRTYRFDDLKMLMAKASDYTHECNEEVPKKR
jgi:hypothetical protein